MIMIHEYNVHAQTSLCLFVCMLIAWKVSEEVVLEVRNLLLRNLILFAKRLWWFMFLLEFDVFWQLAQGYNE